MGAVKVGLGDDPVSGADDADGLDVGLEDGRGVAVGEGVEAGVGLGVTVGAEVGVGVSVGVALFRNKLRPPLYLPVCESLTL